MIEHTHNPSKSMQGRDKKINNIIPQFENLQDPDVIKNHINGIAEIFETEANADKNKLEKILQGLEVKVSDKLELPKVAWEQKNDSGFSTLGTLGNFSLIIGKAKSKKSFFINIAVSAVLNKDLLLSQFKGCLTYDKRKVLYFDTEQGKYHVHKALKRICKQINIEEPEDLKVYHLRSKKPSERLEIIEHAIYNTHDLGFVVIDGIKDLITSINDEGEATMIASKLLKWTEEKEIHIVTVLHQNKSDNNARGHIGTELINKAETVLSVTKNEQDKDISIVEAQQCRNLEPEPFAFEINENGLPVIVENYKIRTEISRKKFDILDLEPFKIYQLLTEVFSKNEKIGYSELVRQLKITYTKQSNIKIGDNKTKELISHCKNEDWILQEKSKAPYTLGQFKDSV